jgi:hypothetical protein
MGSKYLRNSFNCDLFRTRFAVSRSKVSRRALAVFFDATWCVVGEHRPGPVVPEDLFADALNNRGLAGAVLDFFYHEQFTEFLSGLKKMVLVPYIGSYARESRTLMETEAAQNLIKGLEGCL